MSRPATDERILEEAKAEVRRKLAAEEANWLATRIGLACVEYPNVMRSWLDLILRPDFATIHESMLAMQKRIDALEDSLAKARQAFAELKAAQGRPPVRNGPPPRR